MATNEISASAYTAEEGHRQWVKKRWVIAFKKVEGEYDIWGLATRVMRLRM